MKLCCLSLRLFTGVIFHLFACCPNRFCMSPACPPVHMSACLSVCLSVCLSTYLPVNLSTHLPIESIHRSSLNAGNRRCQSADARGNKCNKCILQIHSESIHRSFSTHQHRKPTSLPLPASTRTPTPTRWPCGRSDSLLALTLSANRSEHAPSWLVAHIHPADRVLVLKTFDSSYRRMQERPPSYRGRAVRIFTFDSCFSLKPI